MGQQQLLLIVLGVIIVGIAVVVGINMFSASSVEANKNALTSDLQNLGSMAQQFYRKPVELGGGGNSFTGGTGWTIPTTLATTGNGTYVPTVADQTVTIVGTGTETGADGNPVKVTATVTPTKVTVAITNP
ncbi:MAG: hypothetical protein ACM3Q2_10245 [Syntrophothermus sp.]